MVQINCEVLIVKPLLTIIILPIFLVLVACVQINPNPSGSSDELLVRYIALAYNKGHNLTFDQLSDLLEKTTYDDKVWINYNYFKGAIDLSTFIELREPTSYDPRLVEYFKSIFPINNSSSGFIDNFDDLLPSDSLNPPKIVNETLTKRVYELIKYDYSIKGLFYTWYQKYYVGELTDELIYQYARTLVEIAESYTFEVSSNKASSQFFTQTVKLNSIPTELVLAIMYQESKLFPGSFRAEIFDGKILSVSLGLAHILVDVDNFKTLSSEYNDIGDGMLQFFTFELLRNYYFSDLRAEDLFQIRGSVLLARTYLALIKQKIDSYFSN